MPGFGSLAPSANNGLLEAGNIDLTKRPVVTNADGTISTVRSIDVALDNGKAVLGGPEDNSRVLIPTVSEDGHVLSDQDAVDLYNNTGKHLGKFNNTANAGSYAQSLHNNQDKLYSPQSFGSLAPDMVDPLTGVPFENPPAAQGKFGRIADALLAGLRNTVETPGRAMQEGITTDQAVDWAAPTALGMVAGSRLAGGAPEGALGSSGAKLVQPEGIRAYHGSPYDFDRFDLSKIGTGEGAQAYGHGLYFAENPKVARDYEGMLAKNGYDPAVLARNAIEDHGSLAPSKLADIAIANKHIDPVYSENAYLAADLARKANAGEKLPLPYKGRMYEVNIGAKPEQFLDWDKPLAQMADPVKQALNDAWLAHPDAHAHQTGGQIYESARIVPGEYRDPLAASKTLADAGIPGIRYLDQGSRGAQVPTFDQHLYKPWGGKLDVPEPTRNYVVFNPGIVDILRKYGLAGLAAPTAAGGFGSLIPRQE